MYDLCHNLGYLSLALQFSILNVNCAYVQIRPNALQCDWKVYLSGGLLCLQWNRSALRRTNPSSALAIVGPWHLLFTVYGGKPHKRRK